MVHGPRMMQVSFDEKALSCFKVQKKADSLENLLIRPLAKACTDDDQKDK